MDTERRRTSQGCAKRVRRQSLLVKSMTGLMHDPVKRHLEQVFIVPGCDPLIVRTKRRLERMRGRINPARVEIVPNGTRNQLIKRLLLVNRFLAGKRMSVFSFV